MTAPLTDTFALTADQQAALDAFHTFLLDPTETVFVLSGYSGCGKSTLVSVLLDRLPGFMKTAHLINPAATDYEVALTATTNKAAEALSQITGAGVVTIHSFLGLRVSTDYRSNTTTLIPKSKEPKAGYLLFVDEASYIDAALLDHVFKLTANCKIVFIGDPAQLTPVKSAGTPVFDAHFPGAALTQVVRQAEGNPIIALSTKFRGTVNSGEFFSFKPDGEAIQYLDGDAFKQQIVAEFTRPNWRYADSKILAWTNKCVIGYNQFVRSQVKGDPHFQAGDYAVCNSFITVGKQSVKTDQLVQITGIGEDTYAHNVPGNYMTLDHSLQVFVPKTLAEKHARIKQARAEEDFHLVSVLEDQWADLRAAYACTVNKSQGSTYNSVFIDLDDIRRCNSGNQIARMLYVAISRAKSCVYLTGDIA